MSRSFALILALACMSPAAAAIGHPSRIVSPDQPLDAMIAGSAVRLLPMANGGRVVLNSETARRLGIRPGMFEAQARIGPIHIPGKSAVVAVTIDGVSVKQRILWFERAIAPGLDGAIGPGNVPAAIVTFRLRESTIGEVKYPLPMEDQDLGRLGTAMTIGGEVVHVSWDLTRNISLATAAAGADLARMNGGRLQGAGWQELIRMGVSRPARRMLLTTPLAIGPLRLTSIVTRVSDYRDGSAIPDADADQSEIVVTAKGKAKSEHSLQIGRDDMRGCSSITFDKPARRIVLQCLPS